MKKSLLLAAVVSGLFALTPTDTEARDRSKVTGTCDQCHKKIYSYYRPTGHLFGRTIYSWVPSYHERCSSRERSNSRDYVKGKGNTKTPLVRSSRERNRSRYYYRPNYFFPGLFGYYGGGYYGGGYYGGGYYGGGYHGGGYHGGDYHGGGGHGGGGHGGGGH